MTYDNCLNMHRDSCNVCCNIKCNGAVHLTVLPAFWAGSATSCAHLSAHIWPTTFKIQALLWGRPTGLHTHTDTDIMSSKDEDEEEGFVPSGVITGVSLPGSSLKRQLPQNLDFNGNKFGKTCHCSCRPT